MNTFVSLLALAVVGIVAGSGYGGGNPNPPHGGGGIDIVIPDINIPSPNFDFEGKWASWGSWGRCSKVCGRGEQSRTRVCVKPKNKFIGKFLGCKGVSSQTRHCNTHPCPVNGMWGSWSSFSSCSKSCGGGSKTRSRVCDSPRPANGGRNCSGSSRDSMRCNEDVRCPVDGMWTNWGPFGSCSKPCGGGVKTRDRSCTNPRPAFGGRSCAGSAWDKMKCNHQRCHY